MRFPVKIDDPFRHRCKALLLGCFEGEPVSPLFSRLDEALGGFLSPLFGNREFTGAPNRVKIVHTLGRSPAERVVLVGLGKREDLTAERLRQAAGAALQGMRACGLRSFSSVLHEALGGSEALKSSVEGFALAGYAFNQYKSRGEENGRVEEATLLVPDAGGGERAEVEVREARTVCEAVAFARDLVSQPGNVATPSCLAEKALEMSGKLGIKCRVLERDEMERLGMETLLGVARGSHQPPKFIILEYKGDRGKRGPTVLVGKGVTFDSGGISLKPREGMEKMKSDMAGAGAVMGALMAAAGLRLPVDLVGLIPAVENLPGGGALKPGDVLRSMSGQTVEVVNTDAEGRLILCDALHYAQRYRPAALIDVATLTGACVIALGHQAIGLMGNDDPLKREIRRAGEATGERVWELPLWDEYGEYLKSDIADLKNTGGRTAGTIAAGMFLKRFVGKTRWVHLDIAGTAWEEKGRPYLPKGATGVGVRLLVEYLKGVR